MWKCTHTKKKGGVALKAMQHNSNRSLTLGSINWIWQHIKKCLRLQNYVWEAGGSNLVTINIEIAYMLPNVLNVVLPHKIMVILLQMKNLAHRRIVICILVCSPPWVKISSNGLVMTKTNATLVLDTNALWPWRSSIIPNTLTAAHAM
jgi:hypothetical protein